MELQVGVKIILQNSEGKYLLLVRNEEKYPGLGGQWDIVGGRIDPGISLMDNLSREVKEETGLEITGVPVLLAAQDILKAKHTVRLTYLGETEGEVKLSAEHSLFKWFTREELQNLESLDPYFKELLGKL